MSAVDVWRVELDRPAAEVARLAHALDAAERARGAAFRFELHAARHTVAHAALRDVLARCQGVAPEEVRFATTAAGKPLLASPGPWFSLSHSGAMALVAVAHDRPVGADLEHVGAGGDLDGVAARFFSERERRVLADCGRSEEERRRLLLRMWTCKESCLKEDGRGIGGIESVTTDLDARGRLRARGPRGAWQLAELEPALGYVGAVAARGAPVRVRLHEWRPPFSRAAAQAAGAAA